MKKRSSLYFIGILEGRYPDLTSVPLFNKAYLSRGAAQIDLQLKKKEYPDRTFIIIRLPARIETEDWKGTLGIAR